MRPHRTVDSDLASYFKDERVRLAFSFQSKYLGMSPFRCPSLFTILSFMEYEFGVYPSARRMRRGNDVPWRAWPVRTGRAVPHGNTPVEEVLLLDHLAWARARPAAHGVRTAAGDEAFDAVVVNADFAHAMKPSGARWQSRRRWTDRKIAKKKFSCSTFMMYLGHARARIDGLGAPHDLSERGLPTATSPISKQGAPRPTRLSMYRMLASPTRPWRRQGISTLYVLVPVGNLDQERCGLARDYGAILCARRTLKRLERIGIRDIEKRIRLREDHDTGRLGRPIMSIHHGATFNLSHSLDQMLCFRPHNRFEDMERMYLVGGGTHPWQRPAGDIRERAHYQPPAGRGSGFAG